MHRIFSLDTTIGAAAVGVVLKAAAPLKKGNNLVEIKDLDQMAIFAKGEDVETFRIGLAELLEKRQPRKAELDGLLADLEEGIGSVVIYQTPGKLEVLGTKHDERPTVLFFKHIQSLAVKSTALRDALDSFKEKALV